MLRDILGALADQLREDIATELLTDDIDIVVEPRLVPAPSEGICIDVFTGAPSRDSEQAAFGDITGAYVVTVRARVSANDPTEVQDLLVDMTDDYHALSVAASIENDPTLNGWATFVSVDEDGFSGVLDFSTATQALVGCTWRVVVGQAVS